MQKWRELSAWERWVIEAKGTEPAFSGLYTNTTAPGTYHCKRCDQPLFRSEDKFLSSCGWPSFDDAMTGAVRSLPDADGQRTEIVCGHCGAHLGHVFQGEHLTAKNLRHCVNSVALSFSPLLGPQTRSLIVASGCFWGTEYFLARIPGVLKTEVGYSGGETTNPSYQDVCSGKTGHLEVVRVTYDTHRLDARDILKVFFETHDFTQTNGQGPDIGPQYLSAIFYADDHERELASGLMEELRAMGYEVATTLRPQAPFWSAEAYHQKYYESKGETPYCHRYRPLFPRETP